MRQCKLHSSQIIIIFALEYEVFPLLVSVERQCRILIVELFFLVTELKSFEKNWP